MPILSYLAFSAPGRFEELHGALAAIPGCEVLPSDGAEVLVVVTETAGDDEEREMQHRLRALDPLASLALVYARSDVDGPPASEAPPPC